MNITRILNLFKDNKAIKSLDKSKTFTNNSFIQEAVCISEYFNLNKRSIVVVKKNLYNAEQLYNRISPLLNDDCLFFGVEESFRVESIAASPENMANKVETLSRLIKDSNKVVITHIGALLRILPRVSVFKENCIDISIDDELSLNELKEKLISMGYSRVDHVDTPLTFALRGGIIDVYSINNDKPIRIEFFDRVVDSIRFFDEQSQKTISKTNNISIIPASDILFNDEDINKIEIEVNKILDNSNDPILKTNVERDLEYIKRHVNEISLYSYYAYLDDVGSILDYTFEPLIFIDDEYVINDVSHKIINDNIVFLRELVEDKKIISKYSINNEIYRLLLNRKIITFEPYNDNISRIENINFSNDNYSNILKFINEKYKKSLICLDEKDVKGVINTLVDNNISYNFIYDDEDIIDGINICINSIYESFYSSIEDILIVSGNDLFNIKNNVTRYSNKFNSAEILTSFDDLNVGDYVVHNIHGVGQYMGLETKLINNVHRDFLKIVYRGNSELLVPLEQFKLIRKFVSREGAVVRLNKLGSNEWSNTKAKIKENVNLLAERLIKLYSNREKNIGYKYKEDSLEQIEFEKEFKYKLTEDQQIAIDEVKSDMESSECMDRLVCGDVGFGKTEVAIRAAFKAVYEDKQVAFLCPTTILSIQHYRTFKERFKNYPVNIVLLNRFVSPSVTKDEIKKINEGKVDIVIGTHRILSKDIKFKDLGLLVIDEEQRFGVEHKEKIKEYKNSIDVLSLSATPIPRTLQMSLIGLRQLSQLDTPPDNRYPVQTYVVEKNDNLVVEVIERELSRGGQVFYLVNNISNIYGVARNIQSKIKDASVSVVHGKMDRNEIENVMLNFFENNINVLVCTTIIETGIDIPNANTIIVENADRFGLSQLYQIKGRVGRSNRVAYAYLLVDSTKNLSEIASKRLKAIKEFAQLGSGYKIAMRDLTIRGAGDLLGPDQSGFIDTVGIDMYIEMLNEAIREQKGEVVSDDVNNSKYLNVEVDGYLPKNFTSNDLDKISIYQNIEKIDDLLEFNNYKNSIEDEYGKLPKSVELLFDKKKLDILLSNEDIDSYIENKNYCELSFTKEYSDRVNGVKLFEILTGIDRDIKIRYKDSKIIVRINKVNEYLNIIFEVIEKRKLALNEDR